METKKDSTKVNEELSPKQKTSIWSDYKIGDDLTPEQKTAVWDKYNKEKYDWDPKDLNLLKLDAEGIIKSLEWVLERVMFIDEEGIEKKDKGHLATLNWLKYQIIESVKKD